MSSANWDRRFIELAAHVATWSKDRSRKIGCVLVGPHRDVRAIGYNGFPRGVDDEIEARHERPAKYLWTEHAERNAIYNAARVGVPLAGCTAYMPWYPCMDCARAIVQCGIATVVVVMPDWDDPKYGADFRAAQRLFDEAGIHSRFVEGFVAPVQQ